MQALERQVERGSLFAHTVLTNQIMRLNEDEAFIFGLIDHLIEKEVVRASELEARVAAVRQEIIEKKKFATLGVAIRVDSIEEETVSVDCVERLPICQAACCRLRFALTVEEIESGRMKWELGQPYYNRSGADGYCHKIDSETKRCQIYGARPSVCRTYSCATDPRIWRDFEQRDLNETWIDANLNEKRYHLIEMLMAETSAKA